MIKTLVSVIKEIPNVPKHLRELEEIFDEIAQGSRKTVENLKVNGVVLDKLKKKPTNTIYFDSNE